MKKIGLLTTLLVCGLLLTGCNKTEYPEISENNTGKYLALYPFSSRESHFVYTESNPVQ